MPYPSIPERIRSRYEDPYPRPFDEVVAARPYARFCDDLTLIGRVEQWTDTNYDTYFFYRIEDIDGGAGLPLDALGVYVSFVGPYLFVMRNKDDVWRLVGRDDPSPLAAKVLRAAENHGLQHLSEAELLEEVEVQGRRQTVFAWLFNEEDEPYWLPQARKELL